jgi:hypothetical protein
MEIHVPKESSNGLPLTIGKRVEIRLVVGGALYFAGLRSTLKNSYVWICPDLLDSDQVKVPLARVLRSNNIAKNQRVKLEISGRTINLSPASE